MFTGFGIYSIHENVPERILTPAIEIVSLLTIVVAGWLLARLSQKAPLPEPEG